MTFGNVLKVHATIILINITKIKMQEVNKIPFMVIVGEKEEQEGTVSIRKHGEGDLGTFTIKAFVALIKKEVNKTFVEF